MTTQKPNFLIIGAARCGTTALYHYLKSHHEISMSDIKEPKYFSSIEMKFPHLGKGDLINDRARITSKTKYYNLFKDFNTKAIGEASPDYLFYSKTTSKNILNELGSETKIIIIIRDPIERAFSAYSHLVRDNRENLSFYNALMAEESRKNNNYSFLWHYKEGGEYIRQIADFKSKFKNVLIISSENFQKNKNDTFKKVCRFLGVNTDLNIDEKLKFNPVGKPKNFLVKFILRRDNEFSNLIRQSINFILPDQFLQTITSKFLTKSPIDIKSKEFLKNYYNNEINYLKSLENK
jgi:hypothetical protein